MSDWRKTCPVCGRDETKPDEDFGDSMQNCLCCGSEWNDNDINYNAVKDSYPKGECPDCGEKIPNDVAEGESCSNCEHVFYRETGDKQCMNQSLKSK